MLALDLVQAGYDAHAASDEQAALEQMRELASRRGLTSALILDFSDVSRASVLSRCVISAGVACQVVVVANDDQRRQAEDESVLLDWLGVIPRPVEVSAITSLLGEAAAQHHVRVVREVDSGSLRDDELGDLLARLMEDSSRQPEQINAVLQLKSKGRGGKVAILQGQLVHAQTDDDQGRHALERMFCWRKGMWRLVRGIHSGPRTLRGSARAHVAAAREYARRVRQARLSVPHTDAICTVRWERVRPLPVVAEALFRRIAAGVFMGEALDGDGDDELEAFAALLSRIKRGAVLPQGAGRRPLPGTRDSTSLPIEVSRLVAYSPVVETPQHVEREDRHPSTNSYHSVGDLIAETERTPADLPTDLPEPDVSVREDTPLQSVLPLDLPDCRTDSSPELEPEPLESPTGPGRRPLAGSGWFGANMSNPEGTPTADLSSVQRVLVEAVPAPARREAQPGGALKVSHLPRPKRPQPAAVESAYTLWSNDYAGLESEVDNEVSNYEQLGSPVARSRSQTFLWMAALGVMGALAALVILPSLSPSWQGGDSSGAVAHSAESPVLRTYRQAVGFIDQDRRSEALVLLRNVSGKPGIAPEALLQLAVLEIDTGMRLHGRGHLEQYLDHPKASDKERAARLYKHVFGPRQAEPRTP